MEWRDEGVILSVRRHGETSAIAEMLTAEHGRCLGLVRGGRSRIQRPVLQAGNAVQVTWRARLEEHLGNFTLEPLSLRAGAIMDEPFRLAGLATLAGLAQLLPEREPHGRIYEAISEGQPSEARKAMRTHLTRSLTRYRRLAERQLRAG